MRFTYTAVKDCGCHERAHSFYIDLNKTRIPRECQQTSGKSYGSLYDRGHLVPANHLDFSKQAIRDSNYMTNILPQTKQLNRGSWLQVEEIIECLRETEPLTVVGGAVWNDAMPMPSNESLLWDSHGVRIPKAFWKVVRAKTLHPEDHHIIAWWFPNVDTAFRDELDGYLVSIAQLEHLLVQHARVSTRDGRWKSSAEVFMLPAEIKAHRPSKSWPVPGGCDRSRR